MSYMINNNNPLLLTKITNLGRKAISNGTFNFKYYTLGDSEIAYSNNNNNILFPIDNNPHIKSFLSETNECNPFNEIENIKNETIVLKSNIIKKGFFEDNHINDTKYIDENVKAYGYLKINQLNGLKEINLEHFDKGSLIDINNGDVLILKIQKFFNNEYIEDGENVLTETSVDWNTTNNTHQILHYFVKKQSLKPQLLVDRYLPDFSEYNDTVKINFIVLPNNDNVNNFYNSFVNLPEWNNGNLVYNNCNVDSNNIWFNNSVFCSNIIGNNQDNIQFFNYISQKYLGQLNYFNLCNNCLENNQQNICLKENDDILYQKNNFLILHYNNNSYNNVYGNSFFVSEENLLTIKIPHIMWYNRKSDNAYNDDMGMEFISDTTKRVIDNSTIEYYNLIENPNYTYNNEAIIVGKIFPQYKIIIIEDKELINCLSYKSNRNFSLPPINVNLENSNNNGFLEHNKTLYITYQLKNNNGIKYSFPCGYIKKINNIYGVSKNVKFNIGNLNQFKYMYSSQSQSKEGFKSNKIEVLYQITDLNEEPLSENWKKIDMTVDSLSGGISNNDFIPEILSSDNTFITQFIINNDKIVNSENFNLDEYCLIDNDYGMGGELIFNGNIDLYCQNKIYRTIINIMVNNNFNFTNNDSYQEGLFKVSEIGVFNENKELMMITKLSIPIEIDTNINTNFEISIDF